MERREELERQRASGELLWFVDVVLLIPTPRRCFRAARREHSLKAVWNSPSWDCPGVLPETCASEIVLMHKVTCKCYVNMTETAP